MISELIPSVSPIKKLIFLFLKFKSKEHSSNELKTFNLNNLRSKNNIIICLSEEGKKFNSVELCSLLLNFKNKKINFLIGDTDGISSNIKKDLDNIGW